MNTRTLPLLIALFVSSVILLVPVGEAAAQCTICNMCSTNADCGAGQTCYDFGISVGRYCTMTPCTQGGCPGDSACYTVTLNNDPPTTFCLNPSANQVICDPSYTCFDDGQTCHGLGTDCASGAAACTAVGSALCVTITDQTGPHSFCSCYCATDADCGAGNQCLSLSGGQKACKAGPTAGLCAGVSCPVGETCNIGTGNCVPIGGDLCANVTCPGGAICSPATGTCVGGDLCANVTCTGGAVCSPATGTCVGGTTDTSTSTDTGPADTGTFTDTSLADTATSSDTGTQPADTSTVDTGSSFDAITTNDTASQQSDGGGQYLKPVDDGCGCSTNGPVRSWPAPLLLALGLVLSVLHRQRVS